MLLLAISCTGHKTGTGNSADSVAADTVKALSLEFQVHGMSCTGCENTINEAVKALPGVASVKSSWQDSVTTVTFDKQLTKPDDVKAAIEAKGYEVKSWKLVN
jgi:copper chaperone CopZ